MTGEDIRIRWFRIRRVCEYHKMRVVPRRTVDPPSLDSEKNRQMEVFFRENVTIQNHAHVSRETWKKVAPKAKVG